MNIELEVTNACNAKCLFCPHDLSAKRGVGFMTEETFTRLINITNPFDFQKFYFTGMGEPSLNELLPDFISKINGKHTVVTTNGTLGGDKVRLLKEAGLTEIFFSINYTDAHQSREIMGVDFERVKESISASISAGLRTSALVTISKLTRPQLREIYEWARNQGIENVYFCVGHSRGGHFQNESIIEAHPVISQTCAVIQWNLFVTWNGDILLCSSDLRGEYSYGNIMDNDMQYFLKLRSSQGTDNDLCRKCDCMFRYDSLTIKQILISNGVDASWLSWP